MSWKYFSENELACPCCGQCEMDCEFMENLEGIRDILEFPFVISSGYRCPEYNEKISPTGRDGPHTLGRAVDIAVFGEKAYELIAAADSWGMSGIGVKQCGEYAGRFVHLDNLDKNEGWPRPRVWSYG